MLETATDVSVNYLGRVDFGRGAIDARDITREEALQQAQIVAVEGLMPVADYRDEFGGCMDGRNNHVDETGEAFDPRPKVIGGPSLFAWYAAAIGDFSILRPGADPIEQFQAVNERLHDAGFSLGMHHGCGAAGGVVPVIDNYIEMFAPIASLAGEEASRLAQKPRHFADIKAGLSKTQDALKVHGDDFTEQAMHEIVRAIDGPKALIHLETDHDHPTHGHEEGQLIRLRRPGVKINKPLVIAEGVDAFYSNEEYARVLVEALAQTEEERARGLIIADHLPLAGVATLGKGQHVIEIS